MKRLVCFFVILIKKVGMFVVCMKHSTRASFQSNFTSFPLHCQWPFTCMFCVTIAPHILCLGHQIPLGCRIWCKFACSFWQWHGAIFYLRTNAYSIWWEISHDTTSKLILFLLNHSWIIHSFKYLLRDLSVLLI